MKKAIKAPQSPVLDPPLATQCARSRAVSTFLLCMEAAWHRLFLVGGSGEEMFG